MHESKKSTQAAEYAALGEFTLNDVMQRRKKEAENGRSLFKKKTKT